MPKPVKRTCLAILEVMWDWRSMTSDAGYKRTAPRLYTINPYNFTGRRLYNWLDNKYDLRVTNACKELVSSASGKGTPDPEWLAESIKSMSPPVSLILICGKVAEATFNQIPIEEWEDIDYYLDGPKLIYCPHPAARTWNKESLQAIKTLIRKVDKNAKASTFKIQ